MSEEIPEQEAKFTKEGKVKCPECLVEIAVPEGRVLGRGKGLCPHGHAFQITDKVCFAINDILKNREFLNNFEETDKDGPINRIF